MPVTAWLRKYTVEVLWGLFAAANIGAMIAWPSWETIPFHFVWISVTIVYGFRVWGPRTTALILSAIVLVDVTPRVDQSGVAKVQGFMRERAVAGFATIEEAAAEDLEGLGTSFTER